ncbi:MAG TPA: hypothetical protein VFH80_27075 [Solirubrobacteraceae bacterium]|nr:hypothetical protein [Solirubrobacteraceae bacterium]
MALFGRRRAPDRDQATATTTTALVIEAAAPPQGGPSVGPGSHGPLRIRVDLGSGPRLYDANIRMTEAHWLVPGMDIEIRFDPDHPDRFEIDWDAMPGMEARAASGDPALADPVAARRKVAHALGLTQADTGTARTERVERAIEQARSRPAPPGKQHAVVLIATIRGRRRVVGDPENAVTHDQVTYKRASAAVLSVNVPGRAPYAVYVPRFKCVVDLLEPLWMPLPALVSAVEPTDLEILWNEVPEHHAQLMDRVAGSLAAQQARTEQIDAFTRQALPDRSQMQQLAADSAKHALQYVQDPAMRKMLIDQYRAAGIDLGEDAGQ